MPLNQNYNPKDFESYIYTQWIDAKVGEVTTPTLRVTPSKGVSSAVKTHSILMPPPNLTGNLHAGHSFQHYLMDTLSRLARQRAEQNLWFPGVDHAGLQLEGVIDKLIKKGEFDEILGDYAKNTPLKGSNEVRGSFSDNGDGIPSQAENDDFFNLPKEELPKYLKSNLPDLWLECAWSKVNEWRDNQKNQASVLGDTPDYSRSLFTLDEQNIEMVNYAFLKYWQDGLIYKGSYLVNWSVGLQTALSDVAGEIEYEKRIDPFVTFEYGVKKVEFANTDLESKYSNIKLKSFEQWKRPQLSTVRPETKFTDIAVAMHPSKFAVYFNQDIFETENELNEYFLQDIFDNKVWVYYNLPPLHNGELKLVFTEKVDASFGTGVMKITPAHDPFDYELCKELIAQGKLTNFRVDACIGRDGKLTADFAGEFAGIVAQESRGAIFKRLIETGYIPLKDEEQKESPEFEPVTDSDFRTWKQEKQYEWLKTNYPNHNINWNYEHNVTVCERTKTVVEPLISEEFFISYSNEFNWTPINKDDNISIANRGKKTNLQKLGIEAVNKTDFYSEDYKERGVNFLEGIKDWCISRDLIWGHKMPVWYNLDTNPERKFWSYDELSNPLSKGSELQTLGDSKSDSVQNGDTGVTSTQNQHFAISPTKPTTAGDWVQEEKILDTWFSSCLWPLSTLKYKEFIENKKDKTNVVLIHGGEVWDSKETYRTKIEAGELNRLWYKSSQGSKQTYKTELKDFCKSNHISFIDPQMPNKYNADYTKWKWVFEQSLPFITSETILVGHSLGSMFLTKYLSENEVDCKLVFLVSGGLWKDSEKTIPDFDSIWGLGKDFELLKSYGNKINIVHSKDDGVVDFGRSMELKSNLTNANFLELDGFDHLNSTCEELSNLILSRFNDTNNITDFETFYPTQEMTTGKDIFYQWIVRMTMLSYYFTAEIPYTDLVITPTILDDKGKKMSKSLGNGMDPVAQIDKYSSDSMRMAMLGGMIPDRNIKMGGRLADELCEKYRNFGNKVWNIARFFEYQDEKAKEAK